MKKGAFIVLDGLDGSGKATQSKLLRERLAQEGIEFEMIDFPSYERNFFGSLIGECLAGKRGDFLHIDPKIGSVLYALDRFEEAPRIRSWLAEGKIVIADRYASSNQIHQGGKIPDAGERETFLSWLDTMEFEKLGIPRPDAVIYLRVPVETSTALLREKRAVKNRELPEGEQDTVERDREYVERSYASAELLAKRDPHWHSIDCMDSGMLRAPESIHDELFIIVKKAFDR